jgi:hypothetical protein
MSKKTFARMLFFPAVVPSAIIVMVFANICAALAAGGNMMGYYLPMPMYQNRLESTGVWGVKNVVPRDIYNGIEDSSCKKYSYWDGAIIKGKDGKYHLYCSRWDQSAGHNGWNNSVAVLAVSDSIMGPYIDKGLAYTKDNGKGHNVTAITLPDGRIAMIVCEIVPFEIFIASDPNGPFVYQGSPTINTNGHNIGGAKLASNMSICMREDSTFLIVTRDGFILHSTTGIMGPYLVKTDKIWPMNLAGYNTANWEDPVLWRSGKKYYVTVNCWSSKKAIYMISDDGITAVRSDEMPADKKRTVSLVIKNSGKTMKRAWIISSSAIEGAAGVGIEVYNVNGRLVARMSNVPVTGGSLILNMENPGSKPSPGAYVIRLQTGDRFVQGRLTIQ